MVSAGRFPPRAYQRLKAVGAQRNARQRPDNERHQAIAAEQHRRDQPISPCGHLEEFARALNTVPGTRGARSGRSAPLHGCPDPTASHARFGGARGVRRVVPGRGYRGEHDRAVGLLPVCATGRSHVAGPRRRGLYGSIPPHRLTGTGCARILWEGSGVWRSGRAHWCAGVGGFKALSHWGVRWAASSRRSRAAQQSAVLHESEGPRGPRHGRASARHSRK